MQHRQYRRPSPVPTGPDVRGDCRVAPEPRGYPRPTSSINGFRVRPALTDGSRSGPDRVSTEPGLRDWIRIAAQIEWCAPEGTTVDDLARVEDAAAEWLYQRARVDVDMGRLVSRGQAPGST